MSDDPTRENGPDAETLGAETVEEILERLGPGTALEEALLDGSRPVSRERREVLETLGLVGESVPVMTPPVRLKEELLAAVREAAPAAPEAEVVPIAEPPTRHPHLPRSSYLRWALPVAATLAVALAGVSGWQFARLSGQRATIDRLSARLGELEARTQTVAEMQDRLAEVHARLAMVTQRGVEICALRPMAPQWQEANSRGVLFVAADHQHWYLTIEDLMPCAEGRSYQLWFVPEDGEPVSAGTFDVVAGVRVELSSETMPVATRAVTVTLEPAGGSPRPTGPAVLHGDEVMAVL